MTPELTNTNVEFYSVWKQQPPINCKVQAKGKGDADQERALTSRKAPSLRAGGLQSTLSLIMPSLLFSIIYVETKPPPPHAMPCV